LRNAESDPFERPYEIRVGHGPIAHFEVGLIEGAQAYLEAFHELSITAAGTALLAAANPVVPSPGPAA
jgi:hypothetical protein